MQNSNPGQGQAGSNGSSGAHTGGQQSALQPKSGQQGQQPSGSANAPAKGPDAQSSQSGQGSASGQQRSESQALQQGDAQGQGSVSQRPAGGETLARTAQGAHRAVDATVEKVAPVIDAVHDKLESARGAAQGAKDAASDVQDQIGAAKDQAGEWIGAAREAIVQNPFGAIAGAFLLGAVYVATKRR